MVQPCVCFLWEHTGDEQIETRVVKSIGKTRSISYIFSSILKQKYKTKREIY